MSVWIFDLRCRNPACESHRYAELTVPRVVMSAGHGRTYRLMIGSGTCTACGRGHAEHWIGLRGIPSEAPRGAAGYGCGPNDLRVDTT